MSQKEYKIISLFPELLDNYFSTSIPGRARSAKIYDLELIHLRDYAINDYGQVDDKVYGGGRGMLLMAEPLYQAWNYAQAKAAEKLRTLYCSPRGRKLDQKLVTELAKEPGLIIICGHYEGIDERVLDISQAEEVSLGDFVLTGGELCAMSIIDAVIRLLPGVLPAAEAWQDESFSSDLLAESQYSRPSEWLGRVVPEPLLSGNDQRIDEHRRQSQLLHTYFKRPDLLDRGDFSKKDWEILLKGLKNLDKEGF